MSAAAYPAFDANVVNGRSQRSVFSLVDAYAEGFRLLHMIRQGKMPLDGKTLATEVRSLLDGIRKRALTEGIEPQAIEDAGYAVCAAIDEAVLASSCDFRASWESRPLQVSLFGDHLAGENFFKRLEGLRERGAAQLGVIEVFHRCLVFGFRGRYRLADDDKLHFLTRRVGEDIARNRKSPEPLAPHWARPDAPRVTLHFLVPPAAMAALTLGLALVAWFGLHTALTRQSGAAMETQINVVGMPAKVARLSITLP